MLADKSYLSSAPEGAPDTSFIDSLRKDPPPDLFMFVYKHDTHNQVSFIQATRQSSTLTSPMRRCRHRWRFNKYMCGEVDVVEGRAVEERVFC